MIDLASLIDEVRETGTVIEEGGGGGHIDHLYQDGKLTFGEMKQIFNDVFQGKVVLREKCLSPDTKLYLENNGEKTIKEVVDNKIEDNVLSLDSNGEIKYLPITNWFNNGKKDKWVRITCEDGTEIICTPEHRFIDPETNAEILADELKVGGFVEVFR